MTPITQPQDDMDEDLHEWADLLRKVKASVDISIEKERAEGVDISQEVLDKYPFFKSPTSAEAIGQQQTRLQITLPEDYKKFLHVTNGIGFTGISWIPSLCGIEELQWEQAEDVGFEHLRLETFPPNVTSHEESISLTTDEFNEAPPLERVLIISDEDEETVVFLLEPEYVRKAWVWLAGKRNIQVKDTPDQWL
ncbi:smi1 knr4 family containing [Trichoderma arundinaceum]|uniref:Smi1 knr4 family containing n=1 Tax=Trichoderma arundinaceum TaxID=490622 RepID=A0A395NJB7_TRIAR|nr:smi1 knr4 family containing [Trichoderma arundinaceum]